MDTNPKQKLCLLGLSVFGAVFAIFANSVLADPTPDPPPSHAEATETPSSPPPEADETPHATPVPNEEAEPLEPWFVPTETPTPSKKPSSFSGNSDEPQDVVEESLGISVADRKAREKMQKEDPLRAAVIPNKLALSKAQKRRLDKVKIVQNRIIREQRKRYGIRRLGEDPRGEPELRVCSVNLNNYGLKEDFVKAFRAKKLPARAATERSALAAITEANCSVVALQGVFGMDDKKAVQGLEEFTAKLEKRTEVSWRAFAGESPKELIRNGFLVRNIPEFNVLGIRTFTNVRLFRFGEFQLERAPRPPLQLTLEVKGKNGSGTRSLVLSTFDLRTASGTTEKLSTQLPLAEASRMVVSKQRAEAAGEDAPMFIMLGERAEGQTSIAAKILEGSLHFLDLTKNARCRLTKFLPPAEEEEAAEVEPKKKRAKKKEPVAIDKVECSKPADYFKEYFGVLAETFGPKPVVKKEKVVAAEGEEEHGAEPVERYVEIPESPKARDIRLARARSRTSEIYLPAGDLPAAFEEAFHPGRYAVGEVAVKNGMPESPLVWVELNW